MPISAWKYFDVETQHVSNPLSHAEQIIYEIRLGKYDENRIGIARCLQQRRSSCDMYIKCIKLYLNF